MVEPIDIRTGKPFTSRRQHLHHPPSDGESLGGNWGRARGLMGGCFMGCMMAQQKSVPTARDYVRTGLISQFDGIENVGLGMPHDSSATTWADLAGQATCTLTEYGSFGDCYLQSTKAKNAAVLANTPTWKTFEVVFKMESSYLGLIGWRGNYSGYGITYCYEYGRLITTDNSVVRQVGIPAFSEGSVSFEMESGTTVSRKYKNGAVETSTAVLSGVYTGGGYGIPGRDNVYRNPQCRYYAIRAYDRCLTDAEVAANYAIDKARFNLPD